MLQKNKNLWTISCEQLNISVAKFSMVMCHHWLERHAKRLLYNLQGQCHNEGSQNQNMIVSTISSELQLSLMVSSQAGVSCEKTGLLCSSSRSQ